MTNKEKELLIKCLCEMLYHNVKVEYGRIHEGKDLGETQDFLTGRMIDSYKNNIMIGFTEVYSITPYLRPMSSMTEEEKWDFGRIFNSFSYLKLELLENGLSFHEIYDITGRCDITWNELNTAIDWLNAHHFDYHGLIPMGLALEAPEGMYNLKK